MVPQWVDSLLENDRLASIGAALVFVLIVVLLVFDLVPAEHKETAGALATTSGAFALAAFRRSGAEARRATQDPEQ